MNSQCQEDDLEKFKFYLGAKFEFCHGILFSNVVRKPSFEELAGITQKMRKNEIERLYNHFHMSSITDNITRQNHYCIEIWKQWRFFFNQNMPKKQIIIEIIDQISEIIIYVYENEVPGKYTDASSPSIEN
jgi:hypothetical protein